MTEKISCVWDFGTPCGGTIDKQLMFDEQLEIPICKEHTEEHKEVMILYANEYDIEEIVDMKPEERKRLVYTMVLAGLDTNNITI